jgi:hypothetical protein
MFLQLKPSYHIEEELNKDILCRCKEITGTDNIRNSQFTSYLLETLEVTDHNQCDTKEFMMQKIFK